MKKTYIEPTNTVVRLNTETMIANSPVVNQTLNSGKNVVVDEGVIQGMESRETISSQDAWEEW